LFSLSGRPRRDSTFHMPPDELSLAATLARKTLVLVVDDEYGPRESIAFTLATEFAVETAERATEALVKIKQTQYAAIVLDIRMPEMDGIRAVEELRKIDPLVSVIMLTGYGTLLTAQQAMVAGANQYLRKPPDVAELLAAVLPLLCGRFDTGVPAQVKLALSAPSVVASKA